MPMAKARAILIRVAAAAALVVATLAVGGAIQAVMRVPEAPAAARAHALRKAFAAA